MMELEKAKQIIIEALNMAMLKGCYGLIENQNIIQALNTIQNLPIELNSEDLEK